ncbi:NAD-dependent epimerase/dehydratase family protein [Aggregatilinea lenta]|uniref:NAD-dependent epimerase/dehydratase family protein n=1 Tax=Aggregatilinea lenta TaxID=913108 RepID=UPI000E5A3EE1|nr:NAD-dependent epimerase/dehydratase family protein [Aggregatilinea lenta]
MRYFITGATGFIGGEVARQLIAEGHEVVALVRSPAKAQPLRDLGVETAPGDITDKESMRASMTGVDGVYHVAGWYKIGSGIKARDEAERINVQGTRNVLELMGELEIPKGVYTSTVGVFSDTHGRVPDETYRYDGPFLNEYERSKSLAHYEVAEPMMRDGLPLVIVQPGVVYGPGDTSEIGATLTQYLRRRLPAVPRGTAYCWAHVEDTARGHLQAMDKGAPGEAYIIAGPIATLIDALELGQRITGIPAPRIHLVPGMMKVAARLAGLIGGLVPLPNTYTAETLRTSAGVTYFGANDKARRELGFAPRPLDEGLPGTLLAMMDQLGIER